MGKRKKVGECYSRDAAWAYPLTYSYCYEYLKLYEGKEKCSLFPFFTTGAATKIF